MQKNLMVNKEVHVWHCAHVIEEKQLMAHPLKGLLDRAQLAPGWTRGAIFTKVFGRDSK